MTRGKKVLGESCLGQGGEKVGSFLAVGKGRLLRGARAAGPKARGSPIEKGERGAWTPKTLYLRKRGKRMLDA